MSDSQFRNKVVIITGASSGIGREMALQLAEQEAWLSLAARDAGRLETVRAECQARGGKAIAVRTDVSEESQCAVLVQKTVDAYGRIDALINNAGISMWAIFEDVRDPTIFEKIMRVNYLGSVYCTYHALPYLKKTGGRLVGISSLAGKGGVPTRSGYAASKHAMAGFFDTLRIETAGSGITVTMVYPDFVASEIRKRAFGADGQPLGRSPIREDEIMPVDRCAHMIIRAASGRKRELVMTARGRAGVWVKLIAPGLVDRIARRAITKGR
jgi:NAD(P)-dependent dehydrogenase (short-subunit alcohol dehydrogenase family)